MPIDIYNKDFQNWLKGVLGLNLTHATLCKYIPEQLMTILNDIDNTDLRQLFICLEKNKISELYRTKETGDIRWECGHRKCMELMKFFIRNHTQEHKLKYTWKHQRFSLPTPTKHIDNRGEDLDWKVIRLYMHNDNEEVVGKFTRLEHLDISHSIKVLSYCKLIVSDGLAEPLEKVLYWRTKFMHSPNNMMTEREVFNLLTWTRNLLNNLGKGETTYCTKAVKELQDLTDIDYFVKYQSEDCNQLIAKVLKAKDIADDLDGHIEHDNKNCKSKNQRLQALLESISGVRSETTKRKEINQHDYMRIARESLEKKHEALILDKTEYDEDSDKYKEIEGLQIRTEQHIQAVKASMQRLKDEEMAEEIVKLRNDVETLTGETKQTKMRWPLNNMEIFQRPMCLISAETKDSQAKDEIHLKCNPKAFEQIEKIDLPIVVVAVIGLHNDDKSHLMNHLGFETIQSPNKSIWALCKMHRRQPNTVLMILDFDGLSDVKKGDSNYDNKIFTVATLLCNCLVYSMEGAFDDNAAAKLTFVTDMAKNIRFKGKSFKDNLAPSLILPDFVLCLKDFNLMLTKENKYFEQCLAENKFKAETIFEPKDCIRKYFPKRECFAFPVVHTLDTLEKQNPLNIDLDHPITNFISTMCRFISHIYSMPPKALLASKPVNGKMFVALVDHYVTAIKKCEVLEVNDAFKAVAKLENAKIEKEAVKQYEQQLQKLRLPVSGDVLLQTHTTAQQTTIEYLRKNVIHDKMSRYECQARMKMDSIWSDIKYDNIDKIREICTKNLQAAFKKHLEDEIHNKNYHRAGGFQKFQRDFESLKEEYERNVRGFKREEILWTWYGFVIRMKETEIRIVEADTDLSLKEKEDTKRRKQIESDRILNEQKKGNTKSLNEQTEHLQNHYRILKNNRREQLEIERLSFETLVHERLEQDKETAQREIEKYTLAQGKRMQILETESFDKDLFLANLDQHTRKQDERFQRFENNSLKQVKDAMCMDFERYELEQRSTLQRFENETRKVTVMFEDLKKYKSREDDLLQEYKRFRNESLEQVKEVLRDDFKRFKLEQRSTIQRLEKEIERISRMDVKPEKYDSHHEFRMRDRKVRSTPEDVKKEQYDESRADPYAYLYPQAYQSNNWGQSAFRRPEKGKEKEKM